MLELMILQLIYPKYENLFIFKVLYVYYIIMELHFNYNLYLLENLMQNITQI